MDTVALGTRGLTVSRLCFGTLPLGPLQHRLTPEQGAELILHAAELGINFFDTAELYETYAPLSLALRQAPSLRVCTKSYAYDRPGAEKALRDAQRALGREYIDVFLLHEQESVHTLRGHEQALRFYQRMRDQGEIGAVGISTHRVEAVDAAVDAGLDLVFAILNQSGVGIKGGARQDMEQALARARTHGLGTMAMKVLGGGHLISEREKAFEYILNQDAVSVVALGMASCPEIDYAAALFSHYPPPIEAARLSAIAPRRLVVTDWCEGCGRCVARCGQNALSLDEGRAVVCQDACVRCGYCAAVCPQFCIKVV